MSDFKDELFTKEYLMSKLVPMEFEYKDSIISYLEGLAYFDLEMLDKYLSSHEYINADIMWYMCNAFNIYPRLASILWKHISTMMKIPECILIILGEQHFFTYGLSLIFFSYISDELKHNAKIVCQFHRTIRNYFADCSGKHFEMLENNYFANKFYYGNEILNLIPEDMTIRLLCVFRQLRKKYNKPILNIVGIYDIIYELLEDNGVETLTEKMGARDTTFSFY